MIVVVVDDGLPVISNVVVGIWLALDRAHQCGQLLVIESAVSFEACRCHERLRAFINIDGHEQPALFTFVVVLHLRGDFHFVKAVTVIEQLDLGEIPGQQSLAEASVAEKHVGGLHIHALTNRLHRKILIPTDHQIGQFVPLASVDVIHHQAPVVLRACLAEFDAGIEIALSLEVIS